VRLIRSIEGISEYRLSNGLQVLLIPDPSKSIVTLNMTVFVGSRHEGYGEAGMAHLLEHMLFKGTPTHPNIPELLKRRGANFNGTTWLDRTNYYETLPASSPEQAASNLEFAVALESDRLVNSFISGEDLASEMTVVRNEFERGENNSRRILSQRVQSIAFDWHNYGRSTIGNLSDIERVPVERLQDFYRKFYRPDNVMVVAAGLLDVDQALQILETYYGKLIVPDSPLDRTYTTEPAQDGERSVVLRRVGNTQYVSASYHVPCGASREFAAAEMLAYIFGTEPTGRLYQDLVLTQLAAHISTTSYGLHDPGVAKFDAQVPVDKSIEAAKDALLGCVEQVASKPITREELNRARNQFFKSRQLRAADCTTIAVELSDWASQGDWRLYFLFRDYVESLTPDDCTEVASKYLTRNNRTLGMFIPSEVSERVPIPARPDTVQLLDGYQGRSDQSHGESFDTSPMAIEARTVRGRLVSGLQTALLQKKTRGNTVNLEFNLRYGNEAAITGLVEAADFLPELMLRGTRQLSYQQLQDRLDELRADIQMSGSNCLLSLSIETTRDNLVAVLGTIGEILRYPQLDAEEFELLRRQAMAATESRMSEPNVLASLALRRALAPFPASNVRYVATLEEKIERYQTLRIEQIRQLHQTMLNGQWGELSVVGDFEGVDVLGQLEAIFSDWYSSVEYLRVDQPAQDRLSASVHEILTPEKANAVYYSGMHLSLRDDDVAFPALLIGNYILGGSALTSRLGDRVRQQEGLSYSVGSSLNAHPIDRRSNFSVYAIFSPHQREKLTRVIRQELERWLSDGVTETELNGAVSGFLQSEQLNRSSDGNIASMLVSSIFAKRDLRYYVELEQRIQELNVAQVNSIIRQNIDINRLIQVFAGDF
jgi:zinc protease